MQLVLISTLILKDVKEYQSPYTIQYNETTNVQVKKHLEIIIRYWPNVHGKVLGHHITCKSTFLGHATGAQLAEAVLSALEEENIPP